MNQTQTKIINGNIPTTSIKNTTNKKTKSAYMKFDLFMATSHYNNNEVLNINNFLYITLRVTNNNYAIKTIAHDLYKKLQNPIPKNGYLLKNKVAAIAYPDFDASRYGSIGKPPSSPSHLHMIIFARSPQEKSALIDLLEQQKVNFESLHYEVCTDQKGSLYKLLDYSMKAFAQTGFGNNPKYVPILLPLDNLKSKTNRRKKLSAIGINRLNRHNCITDHFTLGSGL